MMIKNQASMITRRDTIKSLILGSVATAIGLNVGPGVAAAQEAGGSIIWAKPLESNLYDPHTAILGSSWELLHLVYDGLTALDANMNPIPCLAESWGQPNPSTYVFKIRTDAKFSNGRNLNVDDVVGSLKRLTDPKTGSFFRLQMGKIKSISSPNAQTVTVELEEPYAPFLSSLASTMASIIPMKELSEGTFDPMKEMLGAGPFKVASHVQDDNWVLKRNEHYWAAGLPKVSTLIVRIMPADQSRIAGLRDGSIDVASFEASPDVGLLLTGVEGIEVVHNPSTSVFYLMLNAESAQSPFRNEKLRQAVALSIDKQKIVEVALGGIGEISSVMPPLFHACDVNRLQFYKRDIEKAKALLKESGVGPIKFKLAIGPTTAYSVIAQVIKDNVAEIGLDAEISVSDEGSWIKSIWVDNPSPVDASIFWFAGYSDPAMVPLWFNPKLAGFTAGYVPENHELNTAIDKARSLGKDDPARPEALQSLCAAIDTGANQVPLVTRIDTVAFRKEKFAKFDTAHLDGYGNTLFGVEQSELAQ